MFFFFIPTPLSTLNSAIMVQKIYKEKLLDPRWQKKRLQVFQQDNFCCQWCGSKEKTLNVHHFTYNKNGNPWDVEDGDLITLCEDCHFIYHTKTLSSLERELWDFMQLYFGSISTFSIKDALVMQDFNEIILKHKKPTEPRWKK